MDLTTLKARISQAVDRSRLVDTAMQLIAVPSRTGEAGAVSDRLGKILADDGFAVERPIGGYPAAPAVAVRYRAKKPGRTLQFNGHLDTVHLPFIPPRIEGDRIRGSGSSDMKAGIAAAVEALRVLRQTDALEAGGILLTAHDLHETPWGDGRQLEQLIREGLVGDAVLLPEYLNHCIPIIGRGGLTWKVSIRRPGAPIHEVMRPDEPSVIAAAALLIERLNALDQELSRKRDAMAGPESLFIGQIHSGEIFNQYPQECRLEGTRRWLPGTSRKDVEKQFRALLDDVAGRTRTTISAELCPMRDAFQLDQRDPLVPAFQSAYQTVSGKSLPIGAKPFCDDGNSFWELAKIPAITHGPNAGGAHTLEEWVSIDDLVRVATVYALTAVAYCCAN
ncbi:MAG TPA: M20/M25/M40 family metallo-hydrolase [Gemmataceae bacterium]|nr:M20/M25/M40 family metallo-hydrolase [Gemmataceae bacterium]